ncbi:glycosyltransferase [Cellulomonas cellasea]|uniref:GT2 family glycosyltransferase n=1 Tax=Cellulomonas cellasea TaxID=43670 RepID=A0A7W4YAZ9_9CELL|nr:glycosyltransferase [Cellulomonas cellasea]MBB2921971.1 GT2 family glycosyltransferase [Cellulomonas cellasea]
MHQQQQGTGRVVEDDRVTVVVASRDRREELLASLARHRAPVLLLDNDSRDGTADAVRAALPDVEVTRLDHNVGAYARTLGVRAARTPYVAFADDDSWWAPGALGRAAEVLDAHPDVAVVAARIHVGAQERLDPFCGELARSPLPRRPGLPGPAVLGFVACAAMVRADAFASVGGFDDLVRFPGEEERVALDLAADGWQLVYVDDVLVHHHPSPARHSPDARVSAVTRSRVLTAVLRLPVRDVLRTVAAAWGAGPAPRAGLRAALRDVPRALRARRVVPRHVQELRALLRDDPAPTRPAPAPTSAPPQETP